MTDRIFGKPGASLDSSGSTLDGEAAKIGAVGERMTARVLDRLVETNPTAHVFHSLMLPGHNWDIDHVVVTQDDERVRIFVIDSKRWRGDSTYTFDYDAERKKHIVKRDGQDFDGGIVSTVSEAESLWIHLTDYLGPISQLKISVHTVLVIDSSNVGVSHLRRIAHGDRESKEDMSFAAIPLSELGNAMRFWTNSSTTTGKVDDVFWTTVGHIRGLVSWQMPGPKSPTPVPNFNVVPYNGFDGRTHAVPRQYSAYAPSVTSSYQTSSRVVWGIALAFNILCLLLAPLAWPFSGLYLLTSVILMICGIGRNKLNIAATIISGVTTLLGIGLVVVTILMSAAQA